jgi:hypothetical protein
MPLVRGSLNTAQHSTDGRLRTCDGTTGTALEFMAWALCTCTGGKRRMETTNNLDACFKNLKSFLAIKILGRVSEPARLHIREYHPTT